MKPNFIESLKLLAKERRIIFALACLFLMIFIFSLYVGFNIHQNELKLVTHYTAFGTTNFYRDKWYYLLSFVVFGMTVGVVHTLIAMKLIALKGVELTLSFLWLSVVIIFIALAITYQVLKIAALA